MPRIAAKHAPAHTRSELIGLLRFGAKCEGPRETVSPRSSKEDDVCGRELEETEDVLKQEVN